MASGEVQVTINDPRNAINKTDSVSGILLLSLSMGTSETLTLPDTLTAILMARQGFDVYNRPARCRPRSASLSHSSRCSNDWQVFYIICRFMPPKGAVIQRKHLVNICWNTKFDDVNSHVFWRSLELLPLDQRNLDTSQIYSICVTWETLNLQVIKREKQDGLLC